MEIFLYCSAGFVVACLALAIASTIKRVSDLEDRYLEVMGNLEALVDNRKEAARLVDPEKKVRKTMWGCLDER